MFIHELAQQTGVTPKTIRYYESIGLLPPPERAENNYRIYSQDTVDRLRFIAAVRTLDFSLADIATFLAAWDKQQLPCHHILDSVEQHIIEIDRRIADLVALRETLTGIQQQAKALPKDQACGPQCVCHLLQIDEDEASISNGFSID